MLVSMPQPALVIALGLSVAPLYAPAVHAEASPTRPIASRCEVTASPTPTGAVHFEGTCHFRHLGKSGVEATQIVIPQPDGSLRITTTIVYTAANGDELFASFEGTGALIFPPAGPPIAVSFSGTETYAGGTGRFSAASGSASLSGNAVFTTPAGPAGPALGQFEAAGTISY